MCVRGRAAAAAPTSPRMRALRWSAGRPRRFTLLPCLIMEARCMLPLQGPASRRPARVRGGGVGAGGVR